MADKIGLLKSVINTGRNVLDKTSVRAVVTSPVASGFKLSTQPACDTFVRSAQTVEEKLQAAAKKMNLSFSADDLANETFRGNADILSAIANHCQDIYLPNYGSTIRALRKYSYADITPEIIAQLPKDEHMLGRYLLRGFPIYVADEAYKVQQSIKHIPEFAPKLNLGTNVEEAKELLSWYQHLMSNSGEINNALRRGEKLTPKAQKFKDFFDNLSRELGQNKVLIRGTDEFEIPYSILKPGDKFIDKGFLSTMESSGLDNIEKFVFGKHFLVIKAPSTTKAIVPKDWTGEHKMSEIILPRNTKFRVIENKPLADYGTRSNPAVLDRRLLTLEIVE